MMAPIILMHHKLSRLEPVCLVFATDGCAVFSDYPDIEHHVAPLGYDLLQVEPAIAATGTKAIDKFSIRVQDGNAVTVVEFPMSVTQQKQGLGLAAYRGRNQHSEGSVVVWPDSHDAPQITNGYVLDLLDNAHDAPRKTPQIHHDIEIFTRPQAEYLTDGSPYR